MDDVPGPAQLRGAARACSLLAYACGLAGVAGGALLLWEGSLAMAIVVWIVTFAVGACLMGVSLLIRAVAGLDARLQRLQSEVDLVNHDTARVGEGRAPGADRDPWLRH